MENHPVSRMDKTVYGQFLDHINHLVEDGVYAEQVQEQGFEGKGFETYRRTLQKKIKQLFW
jgi:alpha-N-arabinofuranosidase